MMETESIPLLLLLLLMILPLQHAARSARAESESPFASFCIINSLIHSLHFSASLAAFLFLAFSLRLLVLVPGPSRRPPTILSSRLSLASCFCFPQRKSHFRRPPLVTWSVSPAVMPCRLVGDAWGSQQPAQRAQQLGSGSTGLLRVKGGLLLACCTSCHLPCTLHTAVLLVLCSTVVGRTLPGSPKPSRLYWSLQKQYL